MGVNKIWQYMAAGGSVQQVMGTQLGQVPSIVCSFFFSPLVPSVLNIGRLIKILI